MELLIVDSTKKILDESNEKLIKKNKKYYRDVLDFLIMVFEEKNNDDKNENNKKYLNNIYQIKFKNITLHENIFNMYNEIIKKYDLKKPEFIIEAFDLTEIEDPNEIKNVFFDIAQTLSNNLLEKLNYKLIKKTNKEDNKTKFILKYIN